MTDPENPSSNNHPEKISIQPRLSNHQTQDRPAPRDPDFEGLIHQLTRVLEDFRSDKKPAPLPSSPEEAPRIRQTGHIPTPPPEGSESSKRRRRRRRSGDDKPVQEFEKYLPGTRRRRERRRKAIIIISAVILAFAGSNYYVAKFFYRSGVSEGMRRGLEARAAVAETRGGLTGNPDAPEKSPKPPETKKPMP